MKAEDYLNESKETDKINWDGNDGWAIAAYGLMGEVGSLCEVIKKNIRDKPEHFSVQIVEEVGDILWYLFAAARRADIKKIEWPSYDVEKTNNYSSLKKIIDGASYIFRQEPLYTRKGNFDKEIAKKAFKKILDGLHEISLLSGKSLEEIAVDSIEKNRKYWSDPEAGAPVFDGDGVFPHYEMLPRNFKIKFIDIKKESDENDIRRNETIIIMNDVQLGDRLTDNTPEESGYRYHDVFHMMAATCLGWSPVFRRMLKKKRKSNKIIDENEDGARAAIIEEAVVSQVYRYGKQIDFNENANLDENIIKLIMEMTTEYECNRLEGRDWKLYVKRSIELFGKIRGGFEGTIEFDAEKRNYKIIDG